MSESRQSRRDFIKTAATVGAGISMALSSAASYARIIGANERINVAFAGLRSRGKALIVSAVETGGDGLRVHALCDVDSGVLAEQAAAVTKLTGQAPQTEKDFRRVLNDKEIDAVVIATPDHTHAPFGVYAMQADKHVYLEKPCSHNPHEGEVLVKAWKRYGKVVQMGNQQRSAPTSIEAIHPQSCCSIWNSGWWRRSGHRTAAGLFFVPVAPPDRQAIEIFGVFDPASTAFRWKWW